MSWSITVTNNHKVNAAIADDAWVDIDYTFSRFAQVAEATCIGGGHRKKDHRIVRLVVCAPASPTKLNKHCSRLETSQFHHQPPRPRHQRSRPDPPSTRCLGLVIRELKQGGAEHIPSGHYPANAAWFACAVIAHNLAR